MGNPLYIYLPEVPDRNIDQFIGTMQSLDINVAPMSDIGTVQEFSSSDRHLFNTADYAFTLVMNPLARLVSVWSDQIVGELPEGQNVAYHSGQCTSCFYFFMEKSDTFQPKMSFEDFIHGVNSLTVEERNSRVYLAPYTELISQITALAVAEGSNTTFSHIGKLENIQSDMTVVCNAIGKNIPNFAFMNDDVAKYDRTVNHYGKAVDEYYTSELRDIVNEIYSADIAEFNYSN